MGSMGSMIMPHVANFERFKGTVIHGADFKTPEPYRNQRVVVVGVGNTAGDICIDLSTCAESITLVQRSQSTLIPAEILRNAENKRWPDDGSIPVEIADFLAEATPINLRRLNSKIIKAGGGGDSGKYAAMYRALREKGMVVDDGADGEGTEFQVFEKFGGKSPIKTSATNELRYRQASVSEVQALVSIHRSSHLVLDAGCVKLILCGRVGVKHGVELAEMREESVIMTDGSEIPADAVIFAYVPFFNALYGFECNPYRTGYHSIHESLVQMFGEETMKRAGRFWGLDEEGELRQVYRPSGHPAVSSTISRASKSDEQCSSCGTLLAVSLLLDMDPNNW